MANPYDTGLDKNPANYQPLTPLVFLERAAQRPSRPYRHHPRQATRTSYAEFYARTRKLASALAARGIGVGDTVSVMLANTPAMLEAHYGVPMTGAVLHSINTRLDAPAVAFMLDHADTKVLIGDTEFGAVLKEALELAKVKPLLIDYRDLAMRRRRRRGSAISTTRSSSPTATRISLGDAGRRVERHLAQLHQRHDRQSQGRRLPPSRRGADVLREHASPPAWASTRSICGRCRCSIATAGASPGRSASLSGTHVCLRSVRAKPMYDAIADHRVTHLSGAPFVMSALLNAADDGAAAPSTSASPSTTPPRRRPPPCSPRWTRPGSSSPISTG